MPTTVYTILAEHVRPGDTIKTYATDTTEPVTITVVNGGWTDVDSYGNWVEPKDPQNPTHVYLDGDLDETILLAVDDRVHLIRRNA